MDRYKNYLARLARETYFVFLMACAAGAAWYDVSFTPSISDFVINEISRNPAWNALAGSLSALLVVGTGMLWRIPIRYVMAIFVLGAVAGHLFLTIYHR